MSSKKTFAVGITLCNQHVSLLHFEADTEAKACEMAKQAYPDGVIMGAYAEDDEPSALVCKGSNDYDLVARHKSVWITVGNISVHVIRTDEGVAVDLYPAGRETDDALASAYAFASDAIEDDALNDVQLAHYAYGQQLLVQPKPEAPMFLDDIKDRVLATVNSAEDASA